MNKRRAGILLHPTSLPSGVLDNEVEKWIQLMAETGFSVWQVLPIGEPQNGLSPYQCSSAFALNPAFISEYHPLDEADAGYRLFCEEQRFWLDDYVLFKVLKKHFNDANWTTWPEEWRFRQADAMQNIAQSYEHDIKVLKWTQYQLHERWQGIKQKATDSNVLLFGDMPIFVAHDSADVWAHPEWFLLDENGKMKVVTGVPPDYFSETGQRWGNPHYNWNAMRETDYAWWVSRIQHHLGQFDLLRIDHFRGLESSWVIDAACETAVEGYWEKVPGDELLSKLLADNGRQPLVAEDLGVITPEVVALKKKYHLPGMSIMQFGFDQFDDSPHKPKNIEEETVVYTGTHDNNTTKGWFDDLDDGVKYQVLIALGLVERDTTDWRSIPNLSNQVVDTMISRAMSSRAKICILPMQDWLHLGSEARMNIPGTIEGNWQWRFDWNQLTGDQVQKMKQSLDQSQRLVNCEQ